ncbi:MAG: DMT family transporter [bacterium]
MFLSSILFGVMAFLVKVLTGYLPAEEIVFARFLIAFSIVITLALFRIVRLKFTNKPLLLARGLIGGAAIFLYFKAISLIPVSDAVVIEFAYPIFATCFAWIFLKEKAKLPSIIALLVSFLGIYLVSMPVFREFNIGYIYCLISAILAGGAVVTVRQLRKTDSAWSISFALMTGGLLYGGLFTGGRMHIPSFNVSLLLITVAVLAASAQLLLTYAYKFCNVLEGTTISMFTVFVTVLLAVAFLGEQITVEFLCGAGLILGSTIYLLQAHPGEIIR